MDATVVEKIFSRTCRRPVAADEVVMAPVDAVMMHDITGPLAVQAFREMGGDRVHDPGRITVIFDHQVPADSIRAAENQEEMRKFARKQGILNYDLREGICHQVMVEKGRVAPGEIVVGVDSHTCTLGAVGAFATGIGSTDMAFVLKFGALYFRVPRTIRIEVNGSFAPCVGPKDLILSIIGEIGADGAIYQALEFTGETISGMGIPGRMTVANMAIEAGAKAGIIPPDEITWRYIRERRDIEPFTLESDEGATFAAEYTFDASDLEPKVAVPHDVDQVVDVDEVAGRPVDQVFIGSCTNGRFEDLAEAAEVLGDRKVADGVRLIVIPASRAEYIRALRAGVIERFVEAGALVEAPCCGPCMGGAFGLLGPGEVCLSTSNRNFRGRQGSTQAEVYLCSPATAAASAVTGVITDPREVKG
ncbi:MAG: 3-isopropylmalate dehydratase large subunit [Methanoculleaceae archaeon]